MDRSPAILCQRRHLRVGLFLLPQIDHVQGNVLSGGLGHLLPDLLGGCRFEIQEAVGQEHDPHRGRPGPSVGLATP